MLPLACVAGKCVLRTTRVLGRGAGSAFPGLIAERIQPGILELLGSSLSEGCVLITGTNGKTTTSSMLRRILEAAGRDFVGNPSGSNLSRGIISSLLQDAHMNGQIDASLGVFEVDEAALPKVAQSLPTRAIVVLNLFRDQLDRYGEVDSLARVIGGALSSAEVVYLNADDPLVASLGRHVKTGTSVRYFGLQGLDGFSSDGVQLADSDHCPFCQSALVYEQVSLSHLGIYRCPTGDFARPPLDMAATIVDKHENGCLSVEVGNNGSSKHLDLPLPGLHNVYDALAATVVSAGLGVRVGLAAETLEQACPVFGRGEVFRIAGRDLQLLLVKNPTSFNQVLRTLKGAHSSPWLMLINDNLADGTDVSWLWDVDFEQLNSAQVEIMASGTRGLDLAVRLKYAGVNSKVFPNMEQGLAALIRAVPKGGTGSVIATYTAMLGVRREIGKQTKVRDLWR